jgi:hypothetical protein
MDDASAVDCLQSAQHLNDELDRLCRRQPSAVISPELTKGAPCHVLHRDKEAVFVGSMIVDLNNVAVRD